MITTIIDDKHKEHKIVTQQIVVERKTIDVFDNDKLNKL